ncbi:hypothetical protein [Arthrobacter sp.]|uniref:hypothetical protein n=1 Tax=Arthrobacter sp. TaxID=1667 RepID=UPI00281164C0|nr:hypothetical protein [Arthrobacter sp.]
MNEADGIDDFLDNSMRQSLLIASRIAETLARRRQEAQRQQEHQDTQAAHEAQARLAAERSAAHAALAAVHKDQWWEKAQPADIAAAYAVAKGWKDHDPTALAASEKIRHEVLTRYGIDTHDAGPDTAYLESGIETIAAEKARQEEPARSQEQTRKAAAEHEKAMQLLAAARAEEVRAQAEKLTPEMERHQVPVEYLANPELAQALQKAHNAQTPTAIATAETEVKERMFLIGKDGIHGPHIDQLRKETTASVNGADDSHFQDPEFVKAAKDLHEGQAPGRGRVQGLPTGVNGTAVRAGRKGTLRPPRRRRPRDREPRRPIDSSRFQDQEQKAETASAAGYGSAAHREKFAESLESSGATDSQVRGRLASARSEGTHPSAAATTGKGAAKAGKSRTGTTVGAERSKGGLSR